MRVESQSHGDVTIISLSGEFDAADVPSLRRRLDEEVGTGARKVVLNVRRVRFINLSNLGLVVDMSARLRERGGELVVSEPSGLLRPMIGAVGLDRAVRVFAADREAVGHLRVGAHALTTGNGASPSPGSAPRAPEETAGGLAAEGPRAAPP